MFAKASGLDFGNKEGLHVPRAAANLFLESKPSPGQDCLHQGRGQVGASVIVQNVWKCHLFKRISGLQSLGRAVPHPSSSLRCFLSSPLPLSLSSLLALGLKHFEGIEFPKPLISKYLLPTKTAHQLTVRIKNLTMNRAPDNIIRVRGNFWGLFQQDRAALSSRGLVVLTLP